MLVKLAILSLIFAGSYAFSVRIVNGTDAEQGEFPYVVSLRRNQVSHTCGATILNEKFILTAAHCVCNNNVPQDPSGFTIQYGTVKISADKKNSVQVKNITCNNFQMDLLTFDSAVLELEKAIPDDGSWTPVELAKEFDTSVNNSGVIVGWGRLYEDGPIPSILQKLNVDIYTDSVCGVNYKPEHHICFGAHPGGACNGDSGTSLLVNDVQIGIASFITTVCGIANEETPNVYSRVSRYYDWIAKIAGL